MDWEFGIACGVERFCLMYGDNDTRINRVMLKKLNINDNKKRTDKRNKNSS